MGCVGFAFLFFSKLISRLVSYSFRHPTRQINKKVWYKSNLKPSYKNIKNRTADRILLLMIPTHSYMSDYRESLINHFEMKNLVQTC